MHPCGSPFITVLTHLDIPIEIHLVCCRLVLRLLIFMIVFLIINLITCNNIIYTTNTTYNTIITSSTYITYNTHITDTVANITHDTTVACTTILPQLSLLIPFTIP